ncbi:MAG: hypothetical protein D6712_07805 [Chloroflexi bacterium]|nr:MAG: hypothetical protein D6712_07805 [Chloroflexota bacterium]
MSLIPKRLSVKFFTKDGATVELEPLIGVFQSWIQQQAVEGLLIDVADYSHVFEGPGVLLIGDEGDYSLDVSGGRAGVQYTRKRQQGNSLDALITTCLWLARQAGAKLEEDLPLAFDYSTVQITFFDRLNTPNTPKVVEQLHKALTSFFAEQLGINDVQIENATGDSRYAPTFLVKLPQTLAITDLQNTGTEAIQQA